MTPARAARAANMGLGILLAWAGGLLVYVAADVFALGRPWPVFAASVCVALVVAIGVGRWPLVRPRF